MYHNRPMPVPPLNFLDLQVGYFGPPKAATEQETQYGGFSFATKIVGAHGTQKMLAFLGTRPFCTASGMKPLTIEGQTIRWVQTMGRPSVSSPEVKRLYEAAPRLSLRRSRALPRHRPPFATNNSREQLSNQQRYAICRRASYRRNNLILANLRLMTSVGVTGLIEVSPRSAPLARGSQGRPDPKNQGRQRRAPYFEPSSGPRARHGLNLQACGRRRRSTAADVGRNQSSAAACFRHITKSSHTKPIPIRRISLRILILDVVFSMDRSHP